MGEQGLRGRAIRGIFWTVSGGGAHALFQLIFLVVLARLLEPRAFGVVAAATVIFNIAGISSRLGFGAALIQRAELDERYICTAFYFFVLTGAAMVGLAQLAAAPIAAFFRMEGELTEVVRVLSLAILTTNFSEVAAALLRRNLRFKAFAAGTVISHLLGYGCMGVALAYFEFGVWALVGAQLAQCAVRTAIYLHLQPHPKAFHVDLAALRDLLSFGGGITLYQVASNVALQGDNLVVGRWLGAEALGLYGRAYQIAKAPVGMIGHGIVSVLFPTMAQLQHQGDRLAVAFRRSICATALFSLPLGLAMAILAPEVVWVMLGSRWQEVVLPLQILSIGLLFRMTFQVADSFAAAAGAVYRAAWRKLAYAVAVVCGALIGQRWGIAGVAVGVWAALAINFILMSHLLLRITGLPLRMFAAAFLPALFTTAILCGELALLRLALRPFDLHPIATLLIGVATAALILLLLVRSLPRLALGTDGIWVLEAILKHLPGRATKLRQLLLGGGSPSAVVLSPARAPLPQRPLPD